MLYGIIGALVVVIVVLAIKLNHKVLLDEAIIQQEKETLNKINVQLQDAKLKCGLLELEATLRYKELEKILNDTAAAQKAYKEALYLNTIEITNYIETQRATRLNALEYELNSKKEVYKKTLLEILANCELQSKLAKEATANAIEELQLKITSCELAAQYELLKYEALLEPLKLYEKDKLQKLFYTIYLPEEYRDDIDFLLNTVALKVLHPDIISKLVWAEYVKPYLDETIKRVGIKAEPGIYKLTNIENGKSYIGKSTDIKKRIQDHFKSSVGIKSIADLYVHHEILRTGFWNWSIEYIIYCDKEDLSELEKYYIDFFKTQEYGYNRKEGG